MYAITVITDKTGVGTGPESLHWSEVDQPAPQAGEVLISVTAAGVNRADLLQRQGLYPPPPGASPIIGLECSGTIAGLGPDLDDSRWRIGDPCVALLAGGGYAEFVAVPAGQVMAPPPGVDLVTAAGLVEVAATVHSNLGGLRRGAHLLVHGGAGGIGSFAIQYAKQLGAHVTTTVGSDAKAELCRELGADLVLRYDQDWQAAVRESGGVEVILDPMGAKYFHDHVRILRRDGRLVIIGFQGGRSTDVDLASIMAKNLIITSTSLRNRPVEDKARICAELEREVWPMINSGAIRTVPTMVVPMRDAALAHQKLESGDNVGKIVLAAR